MEDTGPWDVWYKSSRMCMTQGRLTLLWIVHLTPVYGLAQKCHKLVTGTDKGKNYKEALTPACRPNILNKHTSVTNTTQQGTH